MAGIIKLTTRRLPQNVFRLGIRTLDDIEVRGAGASRLIYRQLITVSSQKLSNDVYNSHHRRIPNSSTTYFGIRDIQTTSILLQEVIKVPPFADSVSEGDVKFTCKVGDSVRADDVVMEIETDKTTVGVPAPYNGIIEEIYVKDGDTVKAGQQLFKLKKTEGGAAPPPKKAEAAAPPPPPAAKPAAAAPPPPPPPPPPSQPRPAAAAPPPPPPPKPSAPAAQIPVAAIRHAQGIEPTVKSEKVIQVPPFADSVSEGDVKFSVKVGDIVKADEVVMEIETDKTTVGVPAPFNGVILEILVKEGDTVKAGQNLFKIGQIEGDVGAVKPQVSTAAAATPPPPPSTPSPPPVQATPTPPPPPTAPRAAAPPPPPAAKPSAPAARIPAPPSISVKVPPADYSREITGTRTEQRVKMNRMRQKIASRLKEAQNVNAMLTTFNEIDMSGIMEFRKTNQDAFQKKYGIKFGFMSIFCKASAYALQDQPVVNAVIDGTEIVYRDYVDISVAVATPKGLVVPVIRNVESMNYADIEIALAALGEKARKGNIAVEDMDGGTFTISNGGVFGSLMGTPIINPPQSAILGMHGVFDRPVAVKGQVVIRPMMYIALTYDHRLIDGREAVMFLRKIKAAVEDPRIIVAGL